MGGQPAEQIIAGVVLSERLAVTMYGAIHRAQFSGLRNLRGLVVDTKMLAESAFRVALTESRGIATAIGLDHNNIVPTFAVEGAGTDVVVVTRHLAGAHGIQGEQLVAGLVGDLEPLELSAMTCELGQRVGAASFNGLSLGDPSCLGLGEVLTASASAADLPLAAAPEHDRHLGRWRGPPRRRGRHPPLGVVGDEAQVAAGIEPEGGSPERVGVGVGRAVEPPGEPDQVGIAAVLTL